MVDRLLYIPPWIISPRAAEELPASRAALADFRSRYEVDVFEWPCMKAAAEAPPTWQGAVAAIRGGFQPDTHVVAMDTSVAATIMALDGDAPGIRSVVLIGISIPPATLEAMELPALAQTAAASGLFSGSYTFVRHVMQGNSEEEWRRYADIIDDDIDWHYTADFRVSYDALNLLVEKPHVNAPAVMLDKPASQSTFGAELRRELVTGLIPGLESGDVGEWGLRLQDPNTRYAFSQGAISFTSRFATAPAAR